jgi:hypothetical protein
MVDPRQTPAAVLLADGRVLVVGGNMQGNSAELYDPRVGTWTRTTSPGDPRSSFGVVGASLLSDGQVLVIWVDTVGFATR